MSYRALNWAWEMSLPTVQKFVLVALADMADEQDSCFPGRLRLAEMVGASPRSVSRALARLEELQLLKREQRRAPDGFRTSDRYWLRLDHKVTNWQVTDGQVTDETGSVANVSILRGQSVKAIEPPVEPLENTQSGGGEFELDLPDGTRTLRPLPSPFVLTSLMEQWAAVNVPSVNVRAVTSEFVAYWRVGEGSGKRKKNWTLAWRNWLKKEHADNLRRGWKPTVEKPRVRGGRVVR